jgi:hypothetical protein
MNNHERKKKNEARGKDLLEKDKQLKDHERQKGMPIQRLPSEQKTKNKKKKRKQS